MTENPCPLCKQVTPVRPVFSLEQAPLLPVVASGEQQVYASLDVVGCRTCGHWFNRAFRPALSQTMYSHVLTNTPVHPSMLRSQEHVADWIGAGLIGGKRVLEVGGGSGHFARLLAQSAEHVTVYEPSRGLSAEALIEPNLELVSDYYAYRIQQPAVDLVVCRQVLEHVDDPVDLLREMARGLRAGGRLYVEVPRADFLAEHDVVIEFHNAHVQYFFEALFASFAQHAGLEVERSWTLKNGHDMGFLLAPLTYAPEPASFPPPEPPDFRARYQRDQEQLAKLAGPVALYGANWHGAATFHLFDLPQVRWVLDDTPAHWGSALEGRWGRAPVVQPGPEVLDQAQTVLVAAHLHLRALDARLREAGYGGPIVDILNP